MSLTRFFILLREHGWALNLLFIAVAAYLVAGATNSVAARFIRTAPTADDVAAAQPGNQTSGRSSSASAADYTAIRERNLFDAKIEDPQLLEATDEIDTPTAIEGNDYIYGELKKCTLPATLRATLVAEGAKEWSMAVLFLNQSREPEVFSVNEGSNQIAPDAVLVDILDREIVVRRTDHFELCLADGESAPSLVNARRNNQATRSPPRSTGPADPTGAITQTAPNEYNIEGSYLDNTLANLGEVMTQARIVPSFSNGKANGFKLFSIRPNSIYAKIGLQNGDVIQKVNGYEINSPEKGLELFQKLRDGRSVNLELMRRGQVFSQNYTINR